MTSHIVGIHHIGLVVDDIKEMSRFYQEKLGFASESGIINEIKQKVYVNFLSLDGYRIELIQPTGENSPVYNFLCRGGKLNHICYISDDIEISTKYLRKEYGMVPVSSEYSASIKNCEVRFLAKPDGEVIELVQPFNSTDYFPSIEL